MNNSEDNTMQQVTYAGFTIRLLAELIDYLLYALVFSIFMYFIALSNTFSQAINTFLMSILILLPFFMTYLFYKAYFTAKFGGNVGKLINGLVVLNNKTYQQLTFNQSFFRYSLGYLFSSTFFGLGFLAIIKDEKKRAWHDQTTGSTVIIKNNQWVFGLLTLILLLAIHIVLITQAIRLLSQGPISKEIATLISEYNQTQAK